VVETIGIIGTVLAVAGVLLNNRRRRECFYLWLVSNGLTLAVHVMAGIWSLAVRDAIFFLLAIDGLAKWSRREA